MRTRLKVVSGMKLAITITNLTPIRVTMVAGTLFGSAGCASLMESEI